MNVISHAMLTRCVEEGCSTQTVAGASLGNAPFEVEVQSVEPGAATPERSHGESRVLLALAGSGKLMLDAGPQRFTAPCTLLVAPNTRFHVVNNASAVLRLVSVFVPQAEGAG